MNRVIRRQVRRAPVLGAVFAGLVPAAATLAQAAQPAPAPSLSKLPPVWLGLLVIFLLLVIVIMVSLMPSKRGHQD